MILFRCDGPVHNDLDKRMDSIFAHPMARRALRSTQWQDSTQVEVGYTDGYIWVYTYPTVPQLEDHLAWTIVECLGLVGAIAPETWWEFVTFEVSQDDKRPSRRRLEQLVRECVRQARSREGTTSDLAAVVLSGRKGQERLN